MEGGWDDFGQKVDLTARIREILRNYPEGTSIFKELIQNADDAGAREVRLLLDGRSHGTSRLPPGGALSQLQGPALFCFNDATFTEVDFQSIQRIGDSLKKEDSKGTKTGRFGIGFNAVYHLTEVPMFVSGRYVVMFDPQAAYLPNVNPANPGKLVDFLRHRQLLDTYPDQFTPFQAAGCDVFHGKPYAATLFRFPLRTPAQAEISRLSKQGHTPQSIRTQLELFSEEASSMLLFLKNVERLSVWEWPEGSSADGKPTCLFEVQIGDMSADLRKKRNFVSEVMAAQGGQLPPRSVKCNYFLDILSKKFTADQQVSGRLETWAVCNVLGGGRASAMALQKEHAHMKLIPWAGVAGRIASVLGGGGEDAQAATPPVTGLAYCFLPLPVPTGLPVHVNGYFELSSNRRDIWYGDDMIGDGRMRAEWNRALLQDLIAPTYARMLMFVSPKTGPGSAYDSLWPLRAAGPAWQELLDAFYQQAKTMAVVYTLHEGGKWINPEAAVLIPAEGRAMSEPEAGEPTGAGPEGGMPSTLPSILLAEGLPLVRADHAVEDVLITKKVVQHVATPAYLRAHYRLTRPFRLDGPDGPTSRHPSLRSRPSVQLLLRYCLHDLSDTSPAPALTTALDLLPLLPTASGGVRPMVIYTTTQGSAMDELKAMGFSLGICLRALQLRPLDANGSLGNTLTWILEQQALAEKEGEAFELGDLVLVSTDPEELRLFATVASHLLNANDIHVSARALLMSPRVKAMSNVRELSTAHLPVILRYMLPPHWREASMVQWHEETDVPTLAWFKSLWHYLLHRMSGELQPLEEQLPLLPCNEGYVCRLSQKLPCMIRGPAVSGPLLDGLRKLGLLTLHDSLVADLGDVGTVGLAHYLHPCSRSGVLACLRVLAMRTGNDGSLGAAISTHFTPEARKMLRDVLEQESIRALTEEQLKTIRDLPIFLTATPAKPPTPPGADKARPGSPQRVTTLSVQTLCMLDVPLEDWPQYEPLLSSRYLHPESAAQVELFRRLEIPAISKVQWLMTDMFARFAHLDPSLRSRAMLDLVLPDLASLVQADPKFATSIRDLPFLPDTLAQRLSCCSVMYDPEVDELARLLGEEHFPHPDFRTAEVLPVLRQLGLRSTLEYEDVVVVARSIKPAVDSNQAAGLARADNLFAFLNAHAERFFQPVPMGPDPRKRAKPVSFFEKAVALFDEKGKAEERNRLARLEHAERQRCLMIEQLMELPWVPIVSDPTLPFLPWRTPLTDPALRTDPSLRVISAPSKCRLVDDLWHASAFFGIVDAHFVSEPAKNVFGWKSPLSPTVVAAQLVRIAECFHDFSAGHPAPTDPGQGGAASTDDLAGVDSTSVHPEVQRMRQKVTSVVPVLYQMLSAASSSSVQRENVRQVLHGKPWVFVGDRFVHAEQVAFVSQVNATPYLYSVPPDLACFSALLKAHGVRESFGSTDFVQVLQGMAVETRVKVPQGTKAAGPPVALTRRQLELAIALVQRISDEVMQVSDWEIFAPDEHRVLARSTELVYDDAPWISKAQNRSDIRYVHPKISAGVGEKLGIRSFRRLIMESHADQLDFGLPTEAFGQSESLTRRLRHILELYPEGPSILSELIQNADDAGATTVRLMYNARSYGTSSLLGQKMAVWQGPALYFFNDATFSKEDFANIARIGQASKLDKVVSTGRFGLGFNSTYHATDLPMFVSGDNLVIFDPHTKYLPGATTQQPGIKIRFAEADLLSQFPDQFEPFTFFGCTLRDAFAGTLFRFPLRTAELARESEISNSRYEASTIRELFSSFQESIERYLLFLRNVDTIEVYVHGTPGGDDDSEPRTELLYRASRTLQSRSSWQSLSAFMTGPPQRPLSKDAFYAKLKGTPVAQLPRVKQLVEVLFEEGPVKWGGTPIEQSRRRRKDWFQVVAGMGGGQALAMAVADENKHLKLIPFGGAAALLYTQELTEGQQQGERVLVENVPKRGQVFCFLPLPVDSSLPVFVNGYFELSSNRRDIWSGGDMTGGGKLRSDWNQALLADVITPLYVQLVEEVTKVLPFPAALAHYYRLFPSPQHTQKNFSVVSTLFYQLGRPMRLLYSEEHQDGISGSFVRSQDALLVNQDCTPISTHPSDASEPDSAVVASTQRLRDILQKRGMCVVAVPTALRPILVEHKCCHDEAGPPFVRKLLRQPHPGWPANVDDAQFLLLYCIKDLKDDLRELHCLPLVPLANGQLGLFIVQHPSTTATTPHSLDSPPNGRAQLYFIVQESDKALFANAQHILVTSGDALLPRVSEFLHSSLVANQTNIARFGPANLERFLSYVLPPPLSHSPEVVWTPGEPARDGKAVVSEKWVQSLWAYLSTPGLFARTASTQQAGGAFTAFMGKVMSATQPPPPPPPSTQQQPAEPAPTASLLEVSRACGRWTVLPAVTGGKKQFRVLLRVDSGASSMLIPEVVHTNYQLDTESLQLSLGNLGVRVVDRRVLPRQAESVLLAPDSLAFVRPLSAHSIFSLLRQIAGVDDAAVNKAFDNDVDVDGRRALRAFLADKRTIQQAKKDIPDIPSLCAALRQLPIYESYKGSSSPQARVPLEAFTALSPPTGLHALPPPKVEDPALLDTGSHVFMQVHSDSDKELLAFVGVTPMGLTDFYRYYFLPRVGALPPEVRTKATLAMLRDLPTMPDLVPDLRTAAFVPPGGSNSAGSSMGGGADKPRLCRPCDLYDPLKSELNSLLDEDAFPASNLSGPDMIERLRSLGLQTSLTLEGVILSAKSVEDLLHRLQDGDRAARRGQQLYRFLEANMQDLAPNRPADVPPPPPPGPDEPPAAPGVNGSSGSPPGLPLQFLTDIRRLAWLPVCQPDRMLPPPDRPFPRVVPPSQARPKTDSWLCSSQLALCDAEPKSDLLLEALGWSEPINPVTLARQLVALSQHFAQTRSEALSKNLKNELSSKLPGLYESLQQQIVQPGTNDLHREWGMVAKILERRAWVWVAQVPAFCDINRVAFQAPPNSHPYLVQVPEDLVAFAPLLRALRVRETFHARDFAKALEVLQQESNGQALVESEIKRAVNMLKALSKCPVEERRALLGPDNKDTVLYAPAENGVMFRMNELCYNDAEWLMKSIQNRGNLRFVHDKLGNEAARCLGARSLRDALLSSQCSMASQPCPPSAHIATAFSPYIKAAMDKYSKAGDESNAKAEAAGDMVVQALADVLEVADMLQAPAVEVVVDERSHGTESLLHPLLAGVQGSALVIYLPGVVLSPDEVVGHMAPNRELTRKLYPPQQGVRPEDVVAKGDSTGGGTWPPQGRGFASLFHIADCVQVLTGDQFHLFDPLGTYLIGEVSEPQAAGQQDDTGGAEAAQADGTAGTATQAGEAAGIGGDQQPPPFYPSSGPRPGEPVSRRYKLEGQNLHTRFPHQFEPFMSLLPTLLAQNVDVLAAARPAVSGSDRRGDALQAMGPFPVAGTIIRAPFRSKESLLSCLCPTAKSVETRLLSLAESAVPSLLFSLSLARLRVGRWRPSAASGEDGEGGGGDVEALLTTKLTSDPTALRNERKQVILSKEWKKRRNPLASLMNKSSSMVHAMFRVHVLREVRGRSPVDETWFLLDAMAPSTALRDAAQAMPIRDFGTVPLISIAARLQSRSLDDSANWVAAPGRIFCTQDTLVESGLPCHVNAPFFVCESLLPLFDLLETQGQLVTMPSGAFFGLRGPGVDILHPYLQWNKVLLETVFADMLPLMLGLLRDTCMGSGDGRGFYAYWPYLSAMPLRLRALAHASDLPTRLSTGTFFFAQEGRGLPSRFAKLAEAYFLQQATRPQVELFLRSLFSLFAVPYRVAQEMKQANAPIKEVTPQLLRRRLKDGVQQTDRPLTAHEIEAVPGLALDLLCFCLADAGMQEFRSQGHTCRGRWKELVGLPLLPLEDGSVGTVGGVREGGSARPYILARPHERELLPHLRGSFVSGRALRRLGGLLELPDFLSVMGLVRFTPAVLAKHIHTILPADYKDQTRISVAWDEVTPPFSPSWLYRFWRLVPVPVAMELFARWPLVPTTGGDLVSCRLAPAVMRLSLEHLNTDLQEKLEEDAALSASEDAGAATGTLVADGPESAPAPQEAGGRSDGGPESDTVSPRSICLSVMDLYKVKELRAKPAIGQGSRATSPAEPTTDGQAPQQQAREDGAAQPQPTPEPAAPPAPATVDAAPSGGSGAVVMSSAEKDKRKTLLGLLDSIQLPLLELAFFPPEQHWELVPLDPREAVGMALNSLSTFQQGLAWDRLSGSDQDKLLRLLTTSSQSGTSLSLSESERLKLKAFPLFETLAGERVAIAGGGYVILDELDDSRDRFVEEVQRILNSSELSSRAKILRRKPELVDLYRDMQIDFVKRAGILTKFLVPELPSMARDKRQVLLGFIRSRWDAEHDGLVRDEEFVKALTGVKFIEMPSGELRQPSQLYDPQSDVLRELFQNDATIFPPPEFATPEWLPVLNKLGLKNKVDNETLSTVARDIETAATLRPLPFAMAARASTLCRQFVLHANALTSASSDKAFLRDFASIRCLPVEKPGLHMTGGGGSGPTPNREYLLVSYSEACPAKDQHLVWSVMPVILKMHQPEQIIWSALGIVTPPPRDKVVQHLVNLTTGSTDEAEGGSGPSSSSSLSILDQWKHQDPPVAVFQSIFKYLEEHWAALPPRARVILKELPCVPVGNRLVKASRLYLRLTTDLSPFMFEVPRAFGPYDKLFKELGTKQSPSIRDFAQLLSELKQEVGSSPLNPNELEAVIKVVSLLADTLASQRNDSRGGAFSVNDLLQSWEQLYVPDDRCVLVPMDTCLYDDASWLRGRVHAHLLRVVHPRISPQTCETYGILRISQVVRECLEKDFVPELLPSPDNGKLSETFTSAEAARAMAILLSQRGLAVPGERQGGARQDSTGACDLEAKTRTLQDRLKGFTVQHVRTLRSRFLRRRLTSRDNRAAHTSEEQQQQEEEDITSQAEGSMFFVDEELQRVLLASPLLPPSVTPAYVLALAITQMLALGPEGEALVAPLSAILATPKESVGDVMGLLRLDRRDEAKAEHLRRGAPGQVLLVVDRSRVELRPTRVFMKNEIVAWHAEDKVLRYGVVVTPGTDEEGAGEAEGSGGAEERKRSEGAGPAQAGIRRMLVRVAPNKVQEMVTTQVYCFRATRPQDADETAVEPEGSEAAGGGRVVSPRAGGSRASSARGGAADPRVSGLQTTAEEEGQAAVPAPVPVTGLLNAVDDLLARMNLSLSQDKKEVIERNVKLQTDLATAYQQLDETKNQSAALSSEIDRIKAAFQCQICYQRDVDKILAPCGHMLCETCRSNLEAQGRSQCPFCRDRFTFIFPFFKPFS